MFGERYLPDHVVDLVGAGVTQVFAFEVDREVEFFAQALCVIQWRRSAV